MNNTTVTFSIFVYVNIVRKKCRFNNFLLFEKNTYRSNSSKSGFNNIFLHDFNHMRYTILAHLRYTIKFKK